MPFQDVTEKLPGCGNNSHSGKLELALLQLRARSSMRPHLQTARSMSERQQSRSKYEIIRQFTAYVFQWEEDVDGEPRLLEAGTMILADPDFWEDKPWKGAPVVRFLCDDVWLYVERETFIDCTRPSAKVRS